MDMSIIYLSLLIKSKYLSSGTILVTWLGGRQRITFMFIGVEGYKVPF